MNLTKCLDHKIFTIISEIADQMGLETYVIGGYVRDHLLQRNSKDIDIVTLGNGIDLAKYLAHTLKQKKNLTVYKNFGTALVKYNDLEIEFVGARKESYRQNSRKPVVKAGSIDDDQKRRDFTINALAVCLNKDRYGEFVDPFDGYNDLKNKIIRTPCDPQITFSDDPLRMIRAIRFATQLQFTIEPQTYQGICDNANRIKIVSNERITDELEKIILAERPSIGFDLLMKTGLLEYVFPELYNLKGVDIKENKAHKDIFYHTIQVLDNLSAKSNNLWLRWAALLHDIGKPATKKWDNELGWTFHGHDYIGSKMIPVVFKRQKMPLNDRMKYVQKMVKLHLRPIGLAKEEVTDSAIRRLLFEAGDDIDDLMTLCEADITSQNELKVEHFLNNFALVRKKLKEIEEKDAIRNFQPPVKGEEIMEVLNLKPSKEVGIIKDAIKDAILDGKIKNNHNEAYQFMLRKAGELGISIYKK
jgi:poly(A) polymerase